ncbi:MAG: Transcriptional regulator [uncultured bacterium]|nr:MAG: Transcriptional regulator [uncultured bacterium]
MSSANEILGNKIKELREEKNLTQTEFGEKFQLNKQMVSYYENGKREPSIDLIVGFSKYFEVSTDYLLGQSNFKHPLQQALSNRTGLNDESTHAIKKLGIYETHALEMLITNKHFKYFIITLIRYKYTSAESLQNEINTMELSDTPDDNGMQKMFREMQSTKLKSIGKYGYLECYVIEAVKFILESIKTLDKSKFDEDAERLYKSLEKDGQL